MNVPLTPIRFKRRALSLYGQKIGVICGDLRLTYAQFFERCDRLSHALQSLGVRAGDRVAFLAFNCHRLLEAYYGVVQTGAILLPINVRLSKEEIAFILNDSEACILFFDSEFGHHVEEIRSSLRSVKHLIPLDIPSGAPRCSAKTYEDLIFDAVSEAFDAREPDENEVAELFYTSGTTANPKGVMLTHRNLYLHALGCIIATGTRDTDIQLHTIPLFHVNGWGSPQSITCMGGTHLMIRRFEPERVLGLIEHEKATIMLLVPTMATAVVNHPDLHSHDLSSLRIILLGGAAPSAGLVRKMEDAFECPCLTGYGLTETSPILTLAAMKSTLRGASREERLQRQAMTGIPQVGVELKVVADDGTEVKPDGRELGEIIVRADGVMLGYWRQPEESARAIRNGWFHTGDLATIDSEGYVLIVDRKKDIIISGGENISSLEIEKCLTLHPAILECAVVGIPHEQWGEAPCALVVLHEGKKLTEREVLDHCLNNLAQFKCPRSVEFLESLPKGGTGKILKRALREKYWIGHSRRIQG